MRSLAVLASLMAILSSQTADAQRMRRSKTKKAPPPQSQSTRASTPAPSSGADAKLCESRADVINSREQTLNQRRASMAGIDAEISAAEKLLHELQERRVRLVGQVARGEVHLHLKQVEYRAECSQSETCGRYETLATRLDDRAKPIQVSVDKIRSEMAVAQREVGALKKSIDPLRREYERRQCNNLVPGQTAQSTINRCSQIFSEWNRLQGDLNRQNNQLPALKSRYRRLIAQLGNAEKNAKDYETYLTRNCRQSKAIAGLRKHRTVHSNARRLEGELDKLINDVTKLRGIRITVSTP